MINDPNKEYRDTMQEVMIELNVKTTTFLKTLKENSRQDKFHY
jgi:hypothetical protein